MSARQIKYLLIPGLIIKGNDTHRISAPELARLYGVDPRDCFIRKDGAPFRRYDGHLIALMPESSGVYEVTLCQTVADLIQREIVMQDRNPFKDRR